MGWEPVAQTIDPNGDALEEKPLVLHSEDDAVTPIAGAHRVAEAMGGTLVTVGGGDHGVFRMGNEEVDRIVMDYLTNGTAVAGHVPGKPSPEPLPKWDQADRAAAAQQGMSAPIEGADDWYGTHHEPVPAPATDPADVAPAAWCRLRRRCRPRRRCISRRRRPSRTWPGRSTPPPNRCSPRRPLRPRRRPDTANGYLSDVSGTLGA